MAIIIGTVLYKLSTLITGFSLSYLGYRLLLSGIYGGGGDLNVVFENTKLVLKRASPGIFFVLFGSCIIALSVWKGQDLSLTSSDNQQSFTMSKLDKLALQSFKGIMSGEKSADAIGKFEVEAIDDLIKKLEQPNFNKSAAEGQTASRGIASEK